MKLSLRNHEMAWSLALASMLSGCAAALPGPQFPAEHPANPAAAEAPRPAASSALDSYWTPESAAASAADEGGGGGDRDSDHKH